MKAMTLNTSTLITTSNKPSIAAHLKDSRSLAKEELQDLLNGSIHDADVSRMRELANHLLEDYLARKEADDNTAKALRSGFRSFQKWCEVKEVWFLPAKADDVELFLRDKSATQKMSTLTSYRWAISRFHRAAGFPDPTATEVCDQTMTELRKRKAKQREGEKQAPAMREVHLDALTVLWRGSKSLLERRDLAMLTVAYETLVRESELTAIRLCDFHFENSKVVLEIPFTKTNKSGQSEFVGVSSLCWSLIEDYAELAEIDLHGDDLNELLFHKVHWRNKIIKMKSGTGGAVTGLTGRAIDHLFARAHRSLSCSDPDIVRRVSLWSGHSARVGACQDLLTQGCSVLQVQQAGRWKSPEMVYRYGRKILAAESAMTKARANKR